MGVRLKWSREYETNKKQRKSCWCFFGRNQLFFENASQVARFTAEKRAQLNKRLIVKNQLFARHLCVCLSIWCFISTYVFLLQETAVCVTVLACIPCCLVKKAWLFCFHLSRSQLFVVLVCFIRNRLFAQHLIFARKQLFYWATVSFVRNQLFVEHVSRVARYAAEKYGVQPIIWDDMLRERPSFHFSKRLFILFFINTIHQVSVPSLELGPPPHPPSSRKRVCNPPPPPFEVGTLACLLGGGEVPIRRTGEKDKHSVYSMSLGIFRLNLKSIAVQN